MPMIAIMARRPFAISAANFFCFSAGSVDDSTFQPKSPAAAAVPALAACLQDEDWSVRRAAVEALGKLGEHAAAVVPAIAACLQDKDGSARKAAACALGKLGEHAAAAVPLLKKCLEDYIEDVR